MTQAPAPRFAVEMLSADEAAQRLGVRKATLYAYVSRGMLTALPDPSQTRSSLYSAYEVDRLQTAARGGRRPAAVAAPTLYDGLALVDTALTGVVDGEIVIRGHRLVDWARTATLEDTAALLWGTTVAAAFAGPAPVLPPLWHDTAAALRQADPASRSVALWGLAMPQLQGGAELQGDALAQALGQHLRVAFACVLGRAPEATPLHRQVARAWRLPASAQEPLRQALVLCADIMLNLMGLAGRMLASVQGSLAACVGASLQYGFIRLSGGEFEAVESLFDALEDLGRPAEVAASYRARGEALPGVHHVLFPRGDPRAAALLALAGQLGSPAPGWVRAMRGEGPQPVHATLDFGLVALRRSLGAPRHAALAITQMARCTGLLAQVLEQRAQGRRMWIQSRYVGPTGGGR
ncbi:MAG: hypothetical protein IV093_02020 [Rubrivivax sp.]|nr:hypothetical protein [Rubrivivax sp.]